MNSVFRIVFGDYAFTLDRSSLRLTLSETVTETVWAEHASVGWLEVKERQTGVITRHDFSDCTLVSLSEKAGPTGKRILFGLDAPGKIPIDLYFTCGSKEIQLTVEASRDSKTHAIHRVCLLPALCTAPSDSASVVVLPIGEGVVARYDELPKDKILPIWDAERGLTMPFFGAVHGGSALVTITDSAYGAASIQSGAIGWIFDRDPERRRIDLRIQLLPNGDSIAIARAYRDKLIRDRNHLTLRKKLRERPESERLFDAPIESLHAKSIALPADTQNRWEAMEAQFGDLEGAVSNGIPPDWAMVALAGVLYRPESPTFGRSVPLFSVVYRDAAVPRTDASAHSSWALLRQFADVDLAHYPDSLGAFLVAYAVSEDGTATATYSNGAEIVGEAE